MQIVAHLQADRDGVVTWHQVDHRVVPWWSFTKSLLGFAAWQEVQAGRWTWDAPVAGRPFTLRELVLHRAGLPDYGGLDAYQSAVLAGDRPWSFEELWARVEADRLRSPPGTAFMYSNVGYGLLRRELERAWDRPFAEGLRLHVLDPLGLAEARVSTDADDFSQTVFPAPGYHPGWVYHGLVVGPASEAALALHRLPVEALATTAASVSGAPAPWVDAAYGVGVMVGSWPDADAEPFAVVGHGAGGPGSTGAVFRRLDAGSTVAVFTNNPDTSPDGLALERLRGV